MNIEIVILGTSPLLMHNPRMVDPEFAITREIKALTAKRKKTAIDLQQIEDLEWRGGLYTAVISGEEVVTQPCSKVRKCLINAGKISKQGKNVERAFNLTCLDVPLIHAGPKSIEELFKDHSYRSRLSVGVGQKRVMRCRPQFMPWGLIMPALFLEDAGLNFDELARIMDLAGKAERIGDNRVNGYGAFISAVRDTDAADYNAIKPTIKGLTDFFSER